MAMARVQVMTGADDSKDKALVKVVLTRVSIGEALS